MGELISDGTLIYLLYKCPERYLIRLLHFFLIDRQLVKGSFCLEVFALQSIPSDP